jgi:Fe-S-cluster-containing dehydrogenase component
MARLGMVIDLQRCVGCGACALACKAENNTRTRGNGQSYNWADFVMRTEGIFPNVTHVVMPVMCNHCSNAPCVENCPATPKAMFKTPEGITMHDPDLCIGCQMCQASCPYSSEEVGASSLSGATYSALSFNPPDASTQPQWADRSAIIPGCTASPAEVSKKASAVIPTLNKFVPGNAKTVRRAGVVEKCTFCYHRTSNDMQPACVDACPAKARIFGDQEDPSSQIAQILKANKSMRLQEEKGTKPNVHYIGVYAARRI